MWVFGGYENASGACNDLYKFDVNSNEWKKIQVENRPSPRFAHSSFLITDKGTQFYGTYQFFETIMNISLFLAVVATLVKRIINFMSLTCRKFPKKILLPSGN
jgi:hypothetical protein